MISQTINNYFPELYDKMRELEDHRKRSDYNIAEIITACIAMFLFKEGSRNAFNNDRAEGKFRKNYERIFKMRLPHMDTVDGVMRVLGENKGLEFLKTTMVKVLLKKKTLHRFRLLNRYHIVAIDGSGVVSFLEKHCEHCLTKESKKGKITYFHNVLEAKIVCRNGFSISIASEWIENPSEGFKKQDCELKAFKRLAEKIKKIYRQLPICIAADGLYPNKPFFDICKKNEWSYIVTLQEGNLPSVWKEVEPLFDATTGNDYQETVSVGSKESSSFFCWLNGIDYHGHKLNWFTCRERVTFPEKPDEKIQYFVRITNLELNRDNIVEISQAARLRWKIENEGFNTQKNLGYGLGHKYSRVSWLAMKNYYQCLQIAHLINQLVELSTRCQEILGGKITVKHLWKCMLGFLIYQHITDEEILLFSHYKIQIRFT
jgi:hypothetical protein